LPFLYFSKSSLFVLQKRKFFGKKQFFPIDSSHHYVVSGFTYHDSSQQPEKEYTVTRQMKTSPATTRKVKQAISNILKFPKLPISMGPFDTQSNLVEPLIESLGWDTSDPTEVQRAPTDHITMMIQSENKPSIAITTLKQGASIAHSKTKEITFKEAASRGADWSVISNGTELWLFHSKDHAAPFRKLDISDEDVLVGLSPLTKILFQAGALQEEWDAGNTDAVVNDAMTRVIASDDFAKLVAKDLRKKKAKIETTLLHSSIARLTAGSSATAEKASPIPAVKTKSAPKSKTVKKSPPKTKSLEAKTAKKTDTKSVDVKKVAPDSSGKSTPATKAIPKVEWIEGATHKMSRKKNQAFIKYNSVNHESILLPGSIIAAETGKSLGPKIRDKRKEAKSSGLVKAHNGMWEVVEPITFNNPKIAATFAASALVKDPSCWIAKDGEKISLSKAPEAPKKRSTLSIAIS
jgi:hypothetical protein